MNSETLLVVDDEPDLLADIQRLAEQELTCTVHTAPSAGEALRHLSRHDCGLILSDIRMPDMDGMELSSLVLKKYPQTDIILMTAYGTIDLAVAALRRGVYDFITKPLKYDRLFHTINQCFERQRMIRRHSEQEQLLEKQLLRKSFIGESPALLGALHIMELVADTPVTVLITGESGTGKELAARTIHRLSARGNREMIAVNCAALPESILESELFGHCRGAFSGADRNRPGLFAAADGSTLFLDEIGEMPLPLQAKLLRVLQERVIRPLGSTESRKVDIRVLASTNRDLDAMVQEGTFREDLFFRLNEIPLHMPALRQMVADIPLLAKAIISRFCAEVGRPEQTLSNEALRLLCRLPWPGNVRQLQNTLKRAVLLGREDTIGPKDLWPRENSCLCSDTDMDSLAELEYRVAREEVMKKFSHAYLGRLLKKHRGNVTRTARACGLERQSLQHLLRKYSISAESFRSS